MSLLQILFIIFGCIIVAGFLILIFIYIGRKEYKNYCQNYGTSIFRYDKNINSLMPFGNEVVGNDLFKNGIIKSKLIHSNELKKIFYSSEAISNIDLMIADLTSKRNISFKEILFQSQINGFGSAIFDIEITYISISNNEYIIKIRWVPKLLKNKDFSTHLTFDYFADKTKKYGFVAFNVKNIKRLDETLFLLGQKKYFIYNEEILILVFKNKTRAKVRNEINHFIQKFNRTTKLSLHTYGFEGSSWLILENVNSENDYLDKLKALLAFSIFYKRNFLSLNFLNELQLDLETVLSEFKKYEELINKGNIIFENINIRNTKNNSIFKKIIEPKLNTQSEYLLDVFSALPINYNVLNLGAIKKATKQKDFNNKNVFELKSSLVDQMNLTKINKDIIYLIDVDEKEFDYQVKTFEKLQNLTNHKIKYGLKISKFNHFFWSVLSKLEWEILVVDENVIKIDYPIKNVKEIMPNFLNDILISDSQKIIFKTSHNDIQIDDLINLNIHYYY